MPVCLSTSQKRIGYMYPSYTYANEFENISSDAGCFLVLVLIIFTWSTKEALGLNTRHIEKYKNLVNIEKLVKYL